MAAALILYPNNTLTLPVNVNDRIEVTYDTAWVQTNLTMLCRAATSNSFVYYNMPDNPVAARGAYLTPSIQLMKFGIQQWPADCLFRLTKYGDDNTTADGTRLKLTSVDTPARTFMISTTIGLSASALSSTISTTTGTASAAITTVTASNGRNNQQTGSASDPAPQGLSKAESAGIGAGVAFGVLLVVAGILAFMVHARRRKRNPHSRTSRAHHENNGYTKAELRACIPVLFGGTKYYGLGNGNTRGNTAVDNTGARIGTGYEHRQRAVEKDGVPRVEVDGGYRGSPQDHSPSRNSRRYELG